MARTRRDLSKLKVAYSTIVQTLCTDRSDADFLAIKNKVNELSKKNKIKGKFKCRLKNLLLFYSNNTEKCPTWDELSLSN